MARDRALIGGGALLDPLLAVRPLWLVLYGSFQGCAATSPIWLFRAVGSLPERAYVT